MSDTPRTDALGSNGYLETAIALCRELERELAETVRVDGARIAQYETELRAVQRDLTDVNEALIATKPLTKSGGGRGLLREPVQAAPNDPTTLLGRVKARRGSDQIRKLRGERPQDDPWPWIHEGELIAEVERLQSLLSRSIAPFDEVPECPERRS